MSSGPASRPDAARLPLALAAALLVHAGIAAADTRAGVAAAPSAYAVRLIESLPRYAPRAQVTGTIRLWGHGSPKHDFLGKLIARWTAEFHRYQPRVRIIDQMYGTASAIGALYTGAGNLAILGEELSPAERRAFERERHYPPMRIEIATGSLETNYFDYAHMVFVNRANPIAHLSLEQLAAIFGEPKEDGPRATRTWGELGLEGAWADRPIDPYFWRVNEDFALFFRARVLAGSHRWNPAIREFVTYTRASGRIDDRGEQILKALARDPYGIAVSNIRFANPRVKALALASRRGGPYVRPSPRTLITQRYPLTRIVPAFVDSPPGGPIDPAVREFLRFILSREGQQALIEDSGYLPLGARQIRAQLRKLADIRPCGPDDVIAPSAAPSDCAPPQARLQGDGGSLRVWGDPALATLARRWARGFRIGHPRVRITLHMSGSDTAMAGLYTGEADVALMGRAATDSELKAFEWVYRRPPLRVEILRGSLGSPGRSPALVVFVRRGNPLRHVDFAQLQGLLEARPPAGVPRIRTWGQLGLTGQWASRPVELYVPDIESGTGRFLRDVVLSGHELLAWPRITEVSGGDDSTGILSALARDPEGLAIAWLPSAAQPVKEVPLGLRAAGAYVLPTPATIRDGSYALARPVYAYINPGEGARSEAAQLIDYIRSAPEQAALGPGDGYLPLMPKTRSEDAPALKLVGRIPVPGMEGHWGELTLDPASDRLFLSATDQQKVYVVPLQDPAAIHGIADLIDRPQGVLYLPGLGRLAVTTRRNGLVRVLHGNNYRVAATLALSEGADRIAFDPRHRVLIVESGGTDALHGPGWLAMIDPMSGDLVGRIDTGFRTGALALDPQRSRLYAAIPGLDQIAVIDTDTRRILRRLRIAGPPLAMALDSGRRRLLVARGAVSGRRPAALEVLDAVTGRLLASLPSHTGAEDVSFDATRGLIYVTSREGFVEEYRQLDATHYSKGATLATVRGAGTSLLLPGLGELCVAVPPHAGSGAALWLFRPVA